MIARIMNAVTRTMKEGSVSIANNNRKRKRTLAEESQNNVDVRRIFYRLSYEPNPQREKEDCEYRGSGHRVDSERGGVVD
jgi:hypothetical protein